MINKGSWLSYYYNWFTLIGAPMNLTVGKTDAQVACVMSSSLLSSNTSSSLYGKIYISLHSASLDNQSTQSTAEISYPGYSRGYFTRSTDSATGWGIPGAGTNAYNNTTGSLPTPANTTGDSVIMIGLGLAPTGSGTLLYYLTPVLGSFPIISGSVIQLDMWPGVGGIYEI